MTAFALLLVLSLLCYTSVWASQQTCLQNNAQAQGSRFLEVISMGYLVYPGSYFTYTGGSGSNCRSGYCKFPCPSGTYSNVDCATSCNECWPGIGVGVGFLTLHRHLLW